MLRKLSRKIFPLAVLIFVSNFSFGEAPPLRVTNEPLVNSQISPMQCGQFVEYLCDLVPSMWAEKLYDGGFEGLSPYKFVYLKETDFKEKPWYPSGATNRAKFSLDASEKFSGETSQKIEAEAGAPLHGGDFAGWNFSRGKRSE